MHTRRCKLALLVCALIISCQVRAQVAPSEQRGQPEPAVRASQGATAEVFLVRRHFADCTNSDVTATYPSLVVGTVWIAQHPDGNTTVKVAITAEPNTTYHFNLKCSGQLGELTTEDEGQGLAIFSFPTSSIGTVYAFEMQGIPAGTKYQSTQVQFR
jgi:hypothetical protein